MKTWRGNDFQSTKIRKLNINGWILHTSNHAINITYNSEVNIAIATHLFNSVYVSLTHTHVEILGNLVKQICFRWFCFNNKLWVTKHKKKAFEIYIVGGAFTVLAQSTTYSYIRAKSFWKAWQKRTDVGMFSLSLAPSNIAAKRYKLLIFSLSYVLFCAISQ